MERFAQRPDVVIRLAEIRGAKQSFNCRWWMDARSLVLTLAPVCPRSGFRALSKPE